MDQNELAKRIMEIKQEGLRSRVQLKFIHSYMDEMGEYLSKRKLKFDGSSLFIGSHGGRF